MRVLQPVLEFFPFGSVLLVVFLIAVRPPFFFSIRSILLICRSGLCLHRLLAASCAERHQVSAGLSARGHLLFRCLRVHSGCRRRWCAHPLAAGAATSMRSRLPMRREPSGIPTPRLPRHLCECRAPQAAAAPARLRRCPGFRRLCATANPSGLLLPARAPGAPWLPPAVLAPARLLRPPASLRCCDLQFSFALSNFGIEFLIYRWFVILSSS